jgi:nicotinate-nucleotide adenylyltransferase
MSNDDIKIYFYGGAFNPLTITHQRIIDELVDELNLNSCFDKNDILHIGVTYHDYKEYEFDKDIRLKMVKSYMDSKYLDKFGWQVCFQDCRTWEYLHKVYSENAQKLITIIMGEDEYADLKAGKWHYSEDILNTYQIKVIPRNDGISSTKVRQLLKEKNFEEAKKYIDKNTYIILKKEGFINDNETIVKTIL